MKTPMSLIAVLSFAATAAGHAPAYMQMGSSFYSLDPASGKAAKVAVTVPPAEDLTWIEATRELWARRGEGHWHRRPDGRAVSRRSSRCPLLSSLVRVRGSR